MIAGVIMTTGRKNRIIGTVSFGGNECAIFLTLRKACSIDMPDSTQISSKSMASGKARRMETWRLPVASFRNNSGALMPR